jgi:hypothetical protein
VPLDQDHGNESLQKRQPKALKSAIHLMNQVDGQDDIVCEDQIEIGNVGSERDSLSSECEKENGN